MPRADNRILFEVSGPGGIVATDNGDPTDMTPFKSNNRRALNGLALVIVRAKRRQPGPITLAAKVEGLTTAAVTITLK